MAMPCPPGFSNETEPEESAHRTFRGLPTPGAASAVGAMVLLFTYLAAEQEGWRSSTWVLATVSTILPVLTLVVAALMVSRYRYTHIVNHYLGGKRGFSFLVKLVVWILAAVLLLEPTAAVFAVGYILSGPLQALRKKFRQRGAAGATTS